MPSSAVTHGRWYIYQCTIDYTRAKNVSCLVHHLCNCPLATQETPCTNMALWCLHLHCQYLMHTLFKFSPWWDHFKWRSILKMVPPRTLKQCVCAVYWRCKCEHRISRIHAGSFLCKCSKRYTLCSDTYIVELRIAIKACRIIENLSIQVLRIPDCTLMCSRWHPDDPTVPSTCSCRLK